MQSQSQNQSQIKPDQNKPGQPVIAIRDLTKSFRRRTVVDRASFSVARGEITGFLGPNGAGKTTVMNMIMGLIAPDHGTVSLFGIDGGSARKDVLARIGHLQEKPRIYPDMTARAYLAFFGELYGVTPLKRRVDAVLDRVGLAGAADIRLGAYSRGMQQRACLARVMLHQPELLILDEPTLGLDPNGLAEMRAIFLAMRDAGTTLIFSSHQLDEIERIADSLVFMQNGTVVKSGSRADILASIANQASARHLTLEIFEPAQENIDTIRAIPGIAHVSQAGPQTLDIKLDHEPADQRQTRAEIAKAITARGLTPLAITAAKQSLEDLFIRLTAQNAGSMERESAAKGARDKGAGTDPAKANKELAS